jgi:hypothetical protein
MKEVQALIHLVIAIVLLTLGVQILIHPDTYTPLQNAYIILFSVSYSTYCYKDKLINYIRNKDDTE